MADDKLLCTTCGHLVRPEHFPCKKLERYKRNAYGLSRVQRDRLIRMAQSGQYYEGYLSNKFGISYAAVRDICAKEGGYVCMRVDENNKHVSGYYLEAQKATQ